MEIKSQKVNCEKGPKSKSCFETIPSTNFMKILICHIIENTLLVINYIVAIFIVTKHNSCERPFYYGGALLILPFIVNLSILLNEWYYKTDLVVTSGRYNWIKFILILIFIPHISFLLFLITMCGFDITEYYQRRITYVNMTHKIIYTFLNNVSLIFLLVRGVITLDSKTCFVDELGRSACIIYPVIFSIIVGLFVIMTNIQKLTSNRFSAVTMALIVTCYRTIGISFMITYLDFWSMIPLFMMLTSNLMIKLYQDDGEEEKDNDEIDAATGLVWDGDEWVGLQTSTNIIDNEKSDNREKDKSNQKVNIIIKNLLNSFIPIYSEISIITDLSILVFICILYYLININENFNYEETILNNHNFNLTK